MTNTTYRSSATRCLRELAELVAQGAEPEDSLDYVYSNFTELLPFDRVGFADIDDTGSIATARWARSSGMVYLKQGFSAKLARSSLGIVIAHKRPRILNDLPAYLENHPNSRSTKLIVSEGIRSSVTCPLFVAGFPTGLLFFSSNDSDAYDQSHCQLLKEVVGVLSVALLASGNERIMRTNAKTLLARRQHASRPESFESPSNDCRTLHAGNHRVPALEAELPEYRCLSFLSSISALTTDMVLNEAVYRLDGRLLVQAGLRITVSLLARLVEMDAHGDLQQSRVRVRDWIT